MISVVIPLYNKGGFIADAINCILRQTYQDFEIIVVDDGSTDEGTVEVNKISNPKLRLIKQENRGVSAARNRGVEEALGDYVAFFDADDEWKTTHLENLNNLIGKYPQCRAWATNYLINRGGEDYHIILNKLPFTSTYGVLSNYFEVCSYSHPPVWSSAVCVEKSLLLEIGGFPVGITSGEDLITWARIAVKSDWAYSMDATAVFNLGLTSVAKPRRQHDKFDYVGVELYKLLLNNKKMIGLKQYVALWHKMRAMTCLQSHYRKGAINQSFLSIRFNPYNFKVYAYILIAFLPKQIIDKLLERFTR